MMTLRNSRNLYSAKEKSDEDSVLRNQIRKLGLDLKIKLLQQSGIPTMVDKNLLLLFSILETLPPDGSLETHLKEAQIPLKEKIEFGFEVLKSFLNGRFKGRYRDFLERVAEDGEKTEKVGDDLSLMLSQGQFECFSWKGRPLFKSAYDFGIYSMLLWDLKPQTIIEMGTGLGSSAIFLADLCRTFGLETNIITADIRENSFAEEKIQFIQGDLTKIESVFPPEMLDDLKHPVLFIEDAHVNLVNILNYFHPYFQPGDYLIVEDSAMKVDEMKDFMREHGHLYPIDTHYTDFFGRNITSAPNSIFVRK